ncbi:MAG: DUF2254 domain-containing protein [Bacillus sp. (in: Bacteria)]|nr:DUF2254 domain-containing protein [Bacillus sp. (in: firmicutes)]
MKNFLFQLKMNIWVIPSLYCTMASLLAFGVIYIDTVHGKKMEELLPATLLISVELSQTILATIAAALLTMVTITFSTIMVVLTTYSTQFSPRTLSDFITNKVTMRVLGVYMGGFLYSILALLFMREELPYEVIAGPIGVVIAIVCLAFFAYFIHHVSSSIQVSNLINDVTNSTLKTLRDRLQSKKGEIIKITEDRPSLEGQKHRHKTANLKNDKLGYIQLIDYRQLYELAEKHDAVVVVNYPVGSFVKPGDSLFCIYGLSEDRLERLHLHKYVKIGNDRTMLQDVELGIRKIVEVTLRAISPALNDPNTAIDCIFHLGRLLHEVSKHDGKYLNFYHDKQVRIIAAQTNFDDILYTTFYQICHYGKDDVSILLAVYEALFAIGDNNELSIRRKVIQFSKYVDHNFNHVSLHERIFLI